jgi:hypothetical protein
VEGRAASPVVPGGAPAAPPSLVVEVVHFSCGAWLDLLQQVRNKSKDTRPNGDANSCRCGERQNRDPIEFKSLFAFADQHLRGLLVMLATEKIGSFVNIMFQIIPFRKEIIRLHSHNPYSNPKSSTKPAMVS